MAAPLDDPWQDPVPEAPSFSAAFQAAADDLAAIQAMAWIALENRFGQELALELAPLLLLPLIQSAQQEAAERTRQQMQIWQLAEQKQKLAQQAMQPW